MSKRKSKKKRNLGSQRGHTSKASASVVATATTSSASESSSLSSSSKTVVGSVSKAASPAQAAAIDEWRYVRGDIRRIAVLATACVAFELALWFVFSHTGIGNSVYSLIKI